MKLAIGMQLILFLFTLSAFIPITSCFMAITVPYHSSIIAICLHGGPTLQYTCSIAVSHHNYLDSYTEGVPSYR